MLYTTLNKLKENNACADGYAKLLKSVGVDFNKDKEISITHIIESNDIQDAIWALRATTVDCKRLIRDFAVWCAEDVLCIYEDKHPNDKRVRNCIEVTKQYIQGDATIDNLRDARLDAEAAVHAVYAARAARAAEADAATACAARAANAAYVAAEAADRADADDADAYPWAAYAATDAATAYAFWIVTNTDTSKKKMEEKQAKKLLEMMESF